MQTLIVDSNALRNPGLKHFFETSRSHAIAISDLTLIEMHKKNALLTARNSTAIVTRYLDRVFVLKRTDEIQALKVESEGAVSGLFDYDATQDFRDLCKALWTVPVPASLSSAMADGEAQAKAVVESLTLQISDWEDALADAARRFSPMELEAIRRGEQVTAETQAKFNELLKETIGAYHRENLGFSSGTLRLKTLVDTLSFRYPVAVLIYHLLWIKDGRNVGKRIERQVNDVIDLQIASLSTFMNGALTTDGLVRGVSDAMRPILRNLGGYVPNDWSPPDAPSAQ